MNRFDLDRFQREQEEWSDRNFGDRKAADWARDHIDAMAPLLGITEEVGELCHAHLKQGQGIRGDAQQHEVDARDAIGDIVIYLADYCTKRGWNLGEIIDLTWKRVKGRDWQSNQHDGWSEPPSDEEVRAGGEEA